jgi:hypothetical protein
MKVSLLAAIVIGLLFMPLYAQTPEPEEDDTAQQAVEPEVSEEAGEPEQATEPEVIEEVEEVEEVMEAAPVLSVQDMAFCTGYGLLYRRCGKGTFIERFFLQRRYRPDILLDKRLKRRWRRLCRACLVLQRGGKSARGTSREICPQSRLELQENSSRVDR